MALADPHPWPLAAALSADGSLPSHAANYLHYSIFYKELRRGASMWEIVNT